MSKKLIAGAGAVAAFAVALAPLATFAETVGVDTLEITVNDSCTFEATGYTPATTDPVAAAVPFANTYTRTMNAGEVITIAGGKITSNEGEGTPTEITVTCNHDATKNTGTNPGHGYQITALATDLTHTDGESTIPVGTAGAGVSAWSGKFSAVVAKSSSAGDVDGDMQITAGYTDYHALPKTTADVIATGNTSRAAGDKFIIDGYKVSTNASQTAGVYTGSVTYAFVAPVDGTN